MGAPALAVLVVVTAVPQEARLTGTTATSPGQAHGEVWATTVPDIPPRLQRHMQTAPGMGYPPLVVQRMVTSVPRVAWLTVLCWPSGVASGHCSFLAL